MTINLTDTVIHPIYKTKTKTPTLKLLVEITQSRLHRADKVKCMHSKNQHISNQVESKALSPILAVKFFLDVKR